MSQKSLGLIETYGLLAAVEAADAAVKTANVTLIGYEFSKGSGMTTVKVEGDVGAVNSAISAAQSAVLRIGKVASVKVIPRPAEGIEGMVRNNDTEGYEAPKPKNPKSSTAGSTIKGTSKPAKRATKRKSTSKSKAAANKNKVTGKAETKPESVKEMPNKTEPVKSAATTSEPVKADNIEPPK